jgi:hypothetical protein
MIPHVHMPGFTPSNVASMDIYFGLMDLYTKKVKEVSIEFRAPSPERVELEFRGISRKVLSPSGYQPGIEGKEGVLRENEVSVPRQVKESSKEIEDFLMQNGPDQIGNWNG